MKFGNILEPSMDFGIAWTLIFFFYEATLCAFATDTFHLLFHAFFGGFQIAIFATILALKEKMKCL